MFKLSCFYFIFYLYFIGFKKSDKKTADTENVGFEKGTGFSKDLLFEKI